MEHEDCVRSKYCRLCVEELLPLVEFDNLIDNCGVKTEIRELYNANSPTKVEASDGYPQNLCMVCLEQLLKVDEFRLKCLKSVDLLRQRFRPSKARKRKQEVASTTTTTASSPATIEVSSSNPNQAKMAKLMDENIDFENVIVKNEIILHEVPEDEEAENGETLRESRPALEVPFATPPPIVKTGSTVTTVKIQHEDLGEFPMTVLKGYKNSAHVVYEANGFLYVNTRNTTYRKYLRCSTSKNCPAKACIDVKPDAPVNTEDKMYVYKLHNHPKDSLHITKHKFLEEMRIIAASGNHSPKTVYAKALQKYPNMRAVMPYSMLCSRLYRLSTGSSATKTSQFNTLQKFGKHLLDQMPPKCCLTSRQEPFFQDLLIDDLNGSCTLVYCNTLLVESMSWSNEIFVDSSFQVSFDNKTEYNLLSVCITVNEHRLPIFFAIIETPSYGEYKKIFRLFRDKYAPELHPQEIITDFSSALFSALSETYPHAMISGSLIHYIMYVYKQCNVLRIAKLIEGNPACSKLQLQLFSLPILPPQLIPQALEYLHGEAEGAGLGDVFNDVFKYVEDVWVGTVTPQVFSTFCNMSGVNDLIFPTFKKMRDVISPTKRMTFFEMNEKLLQIEDWVWITYQKVISGEKTSRQMSAASKLTRVLDTLWQPNNIDNFVSFFDSVAPLVEKMTGLIWIWGFYNYAGDNSEPLITPQHFFGGDVSKEMMDSVETTEMEEEEEVAEAVVVMAEGAEVEEHHEEPETDQLPMELVQSVEEDGTTVELILSDVDPDYAEVEEEEEEEGIETITFEYHEQDIEEQVEYQ